MMSILLALATLVAAFTAPAPGALAPAALAPKTLAVLYFDNNTGDADYDAVGRGLAAMMITDLAAVDGVKVVEREHLQDLVKEMDAQHSRYFDSTTAVKVGRLAGAEYVVTGALAAVKPRIRIDTRVVRVETGEIVKTAKVQGDEDKFFELQQKLARQLTDDLGLALSPEEQERLRVRQEQNRIDRLRTINGVARALAQADGGDFAGALLTMGPVMRDAPGATVVSATFSLVQRRAAAKTENALKDKVNKGIGGLIRKRWP
jgi:TolB-like protein